MNKRPPCGFTLVEVLVALALAGVITAISLLLLHTTRQVTEEIRQPIRTPLDLLREGLRQDLDHVLPTFRFDDEEPLALSTAEGLQLVSLRPDANGIPHPYLITYQLDGTDLLRIHEGGLPQTASTNAVLTSVRTFRPRAYMDGEEFLSWPPDEAEGVPQRIALTISTLDPAAEETLSFDLPASFVLEGDQE